MTRYIGGDLTYAQRERRYLGKLRSLPVQCATWPFQCFCGTFGFVVYRKRAYCPRCGRRWSEQGLALLRTMTKRNAE